MIKKGWDSRTHSEMGKKGGRKKGSVNSDEQRRKQGESIAKSAWRRHSPNKGSESIQSSSGYGDSDYSVSSGGGRVFPRFNKFETGWDS